MFYAECICDAWYCIRHRFWRFWKNAKESSSWRFNFQFSLWDFSAVWKDLKLELRLKTATSISFWGSGCCANPLDETDQKSVKQHQIWSRDLVFLLFTFCPECGECFAPFYDISILPWLRYSLCVLHASRNFPEYLQKFARACLHIPRIARGEISEGLRISFCGPKWDLPEPKDL